MADLSREARQDLLLATKLRTPPIRSDLVPRPRLHAQVQAGLQGKLLLLSAPAGFGKTTLLSAALRNSGQLTAWMSLDAEDNDPLRFWAYIIEALSSLCAGIADDALRFLQLPQPPPIETMLTVLINALTGVPQDATLVLDDYHAIEAAPLHRGLLFLLDHLPPHLHLVIASRSDPPLPLARLRACGQLTELRAVDLRFTLGEATAFLNQTMGLTLSDGDVAALESCTEGWIVGLHLVALSLHGRTDVTTFITALNGSHRYILDYLIEEVIERQPPHVQRFLLQTSILDRFSAPLCEAVTGESNSQAMLRQLEQDNLFIVLLDEERRWYRYHHLFATLLASRLREAQPEQVAVLHQRASMWFARHGLVTEAVAHAIAGEDFDGATRLIEQTAESLVLRGENTTLLSWLAVIPGEFLRTRPRLGLASAWALVFTNQLERAERCLHEVERALDRATETIDIQRMRTEVIAVRATVASQRRDHDRTIELSRQALAHLPADDPHRGALSLNLGFACRERGEVSPARRAFTKAAALGRERGNLLVAMIALNNVGNLEAAQGHLARAAECYQQALDLAAEQGGQVLPITGVALVGFGALLYEWNDLQAAEHHLLQGVERAKQLGSIVVDVFGALSVARLKQAQGDMQGAFDAIGQVERRLQPPHRSTLRRQLAAYRARLWLAQNKLVLVAQWVEDDDVRFDNKFTYQRETEYMVLARLLIAQHQHQEATELLVNLLQAAEAGERTGSVIQILILQALNAKAHGNTALVLTALTRALSLAESEHYVRTFVDEGTPMVALLRTYIHGRQGHPVGRVSSGYARKLLVALGQEPATTTLPIGDRSEELIEPLSEALSRREVEVLHLLAAGYSNQDIARTLIVGVATVKTHINNIYGKLAVRSRTQAVARARELHLLP